MKPVPVEHVQGALPHLTSPVRVMVQVQLHSGCRTGEVMAMRAADIERTAGVWTYRPHRHKNTYRGQDKVIFLGPKAQAVLLPFLPAVCPVCGLCDRRVKLGWQDSATCCGPCSDRLEEAEIQGPWPATALPREWAERRLFRPIDAVEDRRAERGKKRKTPVQPSQADRRKKKPKRVAGEHYDRQAYRQTIVRGCKLAGVPSWTPLQLRHAAATLIRASHGVEVAKAVLGHTRVETSQIYAEADLQRAARVAAELG